MAKIIGIDLGTTNSCVAIKEIDPQGQKFDPHFHQAISQVEAEGEPNTVVNVLQKGYLLHDRVLRPALVVVSKQKVENA